MKVHYISQKWPTQSLGWLESKIDTKDRSSQKLSISEKLDWFYTLTNNVLLLYRSRINLIFSWCKMIIWGWGEKRVTVVTLEKNYATITLSCLSAINQSPNIRQCFLMVSQKTDKCAIFMHWIYFPQKPKMLLQI